jgi:two-component system chemotaxis response regulator CheY
MDILSPDELSILLVEPSNVQSKIICRHLDREHIDNIAHTTNIKTTIEYLDGHIPDLIISALHYNDGDAVQLIKEVRQNQQWDHVPFMLISSESRKEQLEEFKQAGVVAILPKPFNHDHLGKAINATIDLLSPQELDLSYFDVHDLRVLVVDDSRFARGHIMRVLSNLGVQHMTQACDGQEAINILSENMFDLVVTDYNMPQVNGQELTEYIRSNSQQTHIPILMVTSEANETHLSNIEQSGVNAMCDKPFEPETVKRIIFQLLERD